MKTNKSFSVGIVLVWLSVMLVAIPTPVGASSNIVYIELQPKPLASFMVDGVAYLFLVTAVTASPYGTGNMVIVIKIVSVNLYNASVYVASENLLLGQKYAWLVSLVYPACAPGNYIFESVQSASITIEETATNLTATVSGPISLSITYTPYGDNSTFIEDPGDRPYVDDHDGDGFWSHSKRMACTANGSFNGYQLEPTNLNWGYFDLIDYEWYDLALIKPRTVGVNIGDWFKYGDITVNWSSNDPNATFPPPGWEWLETMNDTEWMLLSVVSGTVDTYIGLQATEHFKNDTERIRSGFITIDTGNSSQTTNETLDMTFMVISADLDANDTIYTLQYSTYRINETIVRTYPDGVRDTNHLNMTWEYSWTINETEYYFYQTLNFYWDRSTGIFVEEYFEGINQTGMYLTTWSCLARITESNVWVVPEFPTWTSILLILVVLTVAIAIFKRRLLKAPIH